MSFQFSHKQSSTYCWSSIGEKGYIEQNQQEFTISFIVALSKERFYGFMGSAWTINAAIVIEFIKEILQTRQKAFNI